VCIRMCARVSVCVCLKEREREKEKERECVCMRECISESRGGGMCSLIKRSDSLADIGLFCGALLRRYRALLWTQGPFAEIWEHLLVDAV